MSPTTAHHLLADFVYLFQPGHIITKHIKQLEYKSVKVKNFYLYKAHVSRLSLYMSID